MRLPSPPRKGYPVEDTMREVINYLRAITINNVIGGLVKQSASGTTLELIKEPDLVLQKNGRFLFTFIDSLQAILIRPGSLAIVDMNMPGNVTPEYPLAGGFPLSEPRKIYLSGQVPGVMYQLFLEIGDTPGISLIDPSSGSGDKKGIVIGTIKFKASPDGLTIDESSQLWESDVIWPEEFSSSGSGGTTSESTSSFSGSSSLDSGSDPGSTGPSGGSDKSTAIVPVDWNDTGYAALFILEAPEVRFDDVMTLRITKRRSSHLIDPRYVSVCEPGSIRVCGWSADALLSGLAAKVEGGRISIEASTAWNRRAALPCHVTLRLTGIRKGFAGKRFPSRTREQFEANEAFINSAYPASNDP